MPGVGVFKGGPGWGTPTSVLKEGMHQGLLAVTGGSAPKGSAMGLEVAASGLVQLPFPFPPSFLLCVVHNIVFHFKLLTVLSAIFAGIPFANFMNM